jgi:vancomycin resistance protein YoaR
VAKAAIIAPKGAHLALSFDPETISAELKARLPDGFLRPAADAHFVFEDGKPKIEDGIPGRALDADQLAAGAAKAALVAGADREVAVQLVDAGPSAGRAELESLGVKEVVGEFRTQATNDWGRTENLKKAAALVTGTLVRPGETFSLNDALGHRSEENGWHSAGVVVGGLMTDGIGGGLSQFSTTLYNASHLAGMTDVEHAPHSTYFSRYPMGREATIWEGQIDNKFQNNTPYGVVIRAWVSADLQVWVQLWSTHYWDVEASIGNAYDVVPTRTVEKPAGPDCKEQAQGNDGFQIDYSRTLRLNGEVKETKTWHWKYQPTLGIKCVEPVG